MSDDILPDTLQSQEPVPSLVRPLILNLVLSVALALATYWVYQQLPATAHVPMHWNAQGKVDGYGPRGSLFLMPGLVAGLALVFFILPRVEPRRGNLLRSTQAYRWLWLGVVVFLSLVQALILSAALGYPVSMDRWMVSGVGLLLALIGNFLGKVRSNFVFGIRTPWTLSSDLSWNRTHRLGGRLFVAGGLLSALMSWLLPKWSFQFFLGTLAVVVLVPVVYSFLVWRQDPNRRS